MSATSDEFRNTIASWLQVNPELLTLVRLNRTGGAKRWYLLRRLEDLDAVVSLSTATDCITVFSSPQLTLRGSSDTAAVRAAVLAMHARSEDFLVSEVRLPEPELVDAEDFGPRDGPDVARWLEDHPQVALAAGPWPPFLDNDPAVALDALVPHDDGTLSFDGAY